MTPKVDSMSTELVQSLAPPPRPQRIGDQRNRDEQADDRDRDQQRPEQNRQHGAGEQADQQHDPDKAPGPEPGDEYPAGAALSAGKPFRAGLIGLRAAARRRNDFRLAARLLGLDGSFARHVISWLQLANDEWRI